MLSSAFPWRCAPAACCASPSAKPWSATHELPLLSLPVAGSGKSCSSRWLQLPACTGSPCNLEHGEQDHLDSTRSVTDAERGVANDEWAEVTLPMPRVLNDGTGDALVQSFEAGAYRELTWAEEAADAPWAPGNPRSEADSRPAPQATTRALEEAPSFGFTELLNEDLQEAEPLEAEPDPVTRHEPSSLEAASPSELSMQSAGLSLPSLLEFARQAAEEEAVQTEVTLDDVGTLEEMAESAPSPPKPSRPGEAAAKCSVVSKPRASARSKGSALCNRQAQLDLLTLRVKKRSLGHANAAATSEAPQPIGSFDVRHSDCDTEVLEFSQNGNCGFTVVMPRTPLMPRGAAAHNFGMCHHYTWDGHHCVSAGLGSEHGNRCSGCLRTVGAAPDLQICKAVGAHAPTSCAKVDSEHVEIVCAPPRRGKRGRPISSCSVDSCPFLAEGSRCPYAALYPRDSTIHL